MHQGCWGHGRAPTSPPRHWEGIQGAGRGAWGHPGAATEAGQILLPSCWLRTLLACGTLGTESEAGEAPCSSCRRRGGRQAWQQHPWVLRVRPGPSTGCWPHGGAGVSLQPRGTSPRSHRAPVHRGDCAQPTPCCTGSRPLRFIKTHKSPPKLMWQRGSRQHGRAAGMCPPQAAPSAPCSQHLHCWRSPMGHSHRTSPGLGALPSISLLPQIQLHTGGVADPIRTQPQPWGCAGLCTRMGKVQVGAARSWEGTKTGKIEEKIKAGCFPPRC